MKIEVASGFAELLNHVNLGSNSLLFNGSSSCCATGTCDS